ncbi:hypothetical protein BaRGS_00029026 [Batillaria attramentaria]|uniref:DDE-1 domain-containing protein n=1 Tax=Batillaria attramentaria TaxID=370345 RepID=A0ABD0JX89_9CAEN
MTQEKFLEWLQHFINTVRPSVENKVLLILDGHSSHTGSLAAIDLARENGVVMLCLPPHTTNKLQPLDISFFCLLKTRFLQAQETWLRNNPGQKVSVCPNGCCDATSVVVCSGRACHLSLSVITAG